MSDLAAPGRVRGKLIWVAVYNDNSVVTQYDENGVERSSESIDRSRLVSFALYDLGGNKFIEQYYKSGQLFMYRCRTVIKTGYDIIERIHIIVCQDGDKRHVVFIFENDLHIEIRDFADGSDQSFVDSKWLYPINQLPIDQIPVG